LVAVIVTIGVVVGAAYYADQKLPLSVKDNAVGGFIPGTEAAVLRNVLARTPSGTEVITSLPISGRLSGRRYLYIYLSTTAPVPIRSTKVMLIMDTAHTLQFVSRAQEKSAARVAVTRFHAVTVVHRSDLWVLQWSSPSSTSSVVLP
jgi:hypothetical protein